MDVTLVKNREDHVHHKHSERHQDRQTPDSITERLRLTLQLSADAGRNDLRRHLIDMIRRIPERHTRLEIEKESHAGELVQVVHHLWTKRGFPTDQFTERHKLLAVI